LLCLSGQSSSKHSRRVYAITYQNTNICSFTSSLERFFIIALIDKISGEDIHSDLLYLILVTLSLSSPEKSVTGHATWSIPQRQSASLLSLIQHSRHHLILYSLRHFPHLFTRSHVFLLGTFILAPLLNTEGILLTKRSEAGECCLFLPFHFEKILLLLAILSHPHAA
jgi:hypothetical protein